MTENKITIRQLVAEDWEIYRDLRLHALKTEPGVFSSNYARESVFSKDEWVERIAVGGKAAFALFDESTPIGLTGVVRMDGVEDAPEVVLVASYILPEYRGRGLSRYFYEARLNWAADQGNVKTVIVSHRESNLASKAANQAFGFVYQGKEMKEWPDGMSENQLLYKLDIQQYKQRRSSLSPTG